MLNKPTTLIHYLDSTHAAITATGVSEVMRVTSGAFIATLHVNLASGTTPTLACEVKYSMNGDNWFAAGTAQTFTTATTTGDYEAKVTWIPEGPLMRVDYTVTGAAASFDCSLVVIEF